jgi:hypothetical protein
MFFRLASSCLSVSTDLPTGFFAAFAIVTRPPPLPASEPCDFQLPASNHFLRKMLLDHLGELRLHPGLGATGCVL